MKILIFSEEYIKITKGMFVVWRNHVAGVSKRCMVDILLNNEHWAVDEASEEFRANANVSLRQLPFKMPSTLVKGLFGWCDNFWILRAGQYMLGQSLNLIMSPMIIFYLTFRLRQIKPSAVFSHNGGWPAGVLCRWIIVAACFARVPKRILIIHNYPQKFKGIVLRTLFSPIRFIQARLMDCCTTSIVTVSDSVKASLVGDVFYRSVTRIHNGIPSMEQLPNVLPDIFSLDWQPSGAVVGFVGALYPMKGPHVLLDAFKLVDIPCELALLGPAEPLYLKTLEQKAELCANTVSFLGFHSDVDAFMQKIDILVVPSIAFESFGMVILEAMKHKKPVICSDFGGMKEIVEDGVTGLVVPASDDAAMANAITRLLSDRDLMLQMGEAGYRRLNDFFTLEKMEGQYNELLG
jgi:teichuronic acid biosynthesis glycosyltransferase TuaC